MGGKCGFFKFTAAFASLRSPWRRYICVMTDGDNAKRTAELNRLSVL